MPKFQFRLESVLMVRRHERTRQRYLVAEAARHCESLREQLRSLEHQVHSFREAPVVEQSRTLDIEALRRRNSYQLELARLMIDLRQAISQAADVERAMRDELREADQRVKVLERLRDRKLTEHRAESEKVAERESAELWQAGQSLSGDSSGERRLS